VRDPVLKTVVNAGEHDPRIAMTGQRDQDKNPPSTAKAQPAHQTSFAFDPDLGECPASRTTSHLRADAPEGLRRR